MAMQGIAVHIVPQRQSISDSFTYRTLGKYFRIFCQQPLFDCMKDRNSLTASEGNNLTFTKGRTSFPNVFFYGIECSDLLHGITSPVFIIIYCFIKFTPDVSHAVELLNLITVFE